MGNPNRFADYMVLETSNYPSELESIETSDDLLSEGDIVYSAGFVPKFMPVGETMVLADVIKKGFLGVVEKVNVNFPINTLGPSAFYRITMTTESGFSGGPISTADGRVAAITLAQLNNYVYAIPIKDIVNFIDQIKKP